MPRAVVAVWESLAGTGGLGRMAAAQVQVLEELGWEVQAITPDHLSRPAVNRRYPLLNIALQSWQLSSIARAAAGRDAVLFSHGLCGARGNLGRQIQVYHGTWAALARTCRSRLSKREFLILGGLNGLLERLSGRRAVNVAVSERVAAEVSQYYRLPGAHVLYNGIDVKRFGPGYRVAGRDGAPFVGLSVGRLDYGKGRDTLRRLGELLPAEYRLRIAGAASGTELWPDGRVEALGTLPYERLPEVYEGADYLICASRYEGFGLTMIEAWASGRPVVTTNVGIVTELRAREPSLDRMVVDDPDDAAGFARKVQQLRSDPELADRQVRWGRYVAREEFSLACYRRNWKTLLQDWS